MGTRHLCGALKPERFKVCALLRQRFGNQRDLMGPLKQYQSDI